MEEDFSALVDEQIPKNKKLAQDGKLEQSLENLLSLEKQTRQGRDTPSTSKILVTIVELCHEAKDVKLLLENVKLLAKRRGQLEQAIKAMVKKAMVYLDQMEYSDKMTLIKTLVEVTEGKIFVEKQRARLTLMLAHIREKEGKIAEAATILQEIQVETFGAMKKKEKTEFILEQMRLCLAKKDYVRAQIISRKISKRALEDKEFQDIKVKYYILMVEYYAHEGKYLEICRCYQQIYNTPIIKEDSEKWKPYMQLMLVFVILAPYDNEQSDLINRLSLDPNLENIPFYRSLLKRFLTDEIMPWPQIESQYKEELLKLDAFKASNAATLWEDFKTRVIEHNIRVVAKYYSRISTKRLAELLNLDEAVTERHIANLVVSKSIYAKIDRPHGIASFKKQKDPSEVLNDWASDLTSLLGRVETVCHLIHRENMIHKTKSKQPQLDTL